MTPSYPMPPQVERLKSGALAAGLAGAAACLVGLWLEPSQFFHSYLVAFLFWCGLAVGCLSLSFIHHQTGGLWGLLLRRLLEAGTRTFPLLALLFVPLLFGLPRNFVWAQPSAAHDELIQAKSPYLNVPFFTARAAVYFAVWIGLAHLLNKWSADLETGDGGRQARRLRGLAGGGLLFLGLTITFSSIDWGMSLDPHWYSTMYGVLFMVGTALSALTLMVMMVGALAEEAPFAGVLQREQVHDLGKLLLAFVMLWAYVSYSQFLITWAGNLPEEIPWYLRRLQGGWQWLALALVLLHFALPFLMLLSRDLKRNVGLLGRVAGLLLCLRFVDLYWLVAPDWAGPGHDRAGAFRPHWLDLAAAVAVGGLWLAFFARQLQSRPLLPLGDPDLEELRGQAAPAARHA